MREKLEVFICENCGYEDSSFIPMRLKNRVECPRCKIIVSRNIVEINNEPDMSINEFNELLEYINKNHSFIGLKGKMIKYISPTIDLRTGHIGMVRLDDKTFSKTNENRHKNLKNWIMEYLQS